MKRVFLIHCWEDNSKSHWYPWLKTKLEKSGFEVFALDMPNTLQPKISEWVKTLKKEVGRLDVDTYFVGHSIGCQAILRFLETYPKNEICGGAVFVAGWFDLLDASYDSDEGREIIRPWIDISIDFEKVKESLDKSTAIFSDDDPYVSREQSEIFKEELGSKIIVEHGKGHFTEDDGVTELPVVLEEILRLSK